MGRMIVGFSVGAVAGYFLGALLGCEILMPASNLCGVGGAFVGFPVGGIAGALTARRIGKRRSGAAAARTVGPEGVDPGT